MGRIQDRTVAKTLIAGAVGWGLLVLALIAFPWVAGPSLAEDGPGPNQPVTQEIEEGASRTQAADLSIVKSTETSSGDPGIVFNGERITYTLTVSNPASVEASNLLILDVLPEDTLADIWCSDGCARLVERQEVPSPLGDIIVVTVTRQISWAVDLLAPNETVVRRFSGRVTGQGDGTYLHNRAFLSYSQGGSNKNGLSNETQTVVRVRINEDGRASLSSAPTWISADFGGTLGMDWGDFDGDGDLDLALGSTIGTTVYRNDGGRLTRFWSNDRLTYDVKWADVNNDDTLELVAVGESLDHTPATSGTNYVYVPNAQGFSEIEFASAEQQLRVAPGDYDGDGYLDLVLSTNSINVPCPIRLFKNTRNASEPFAGPGVCLAQEATAALAPVDYDGDGHLDLALGRFPNATRLLVNSGVLSDTSPLTYTRSVTIDEFAVYIPYDFAWGDYDGDGDLDLAAAYPLERKVRIYRNEPDNPPDRRFVYDTEVRTNLFYTPLAVAWGDMNGDGRLDLAVADAPPKVYEYRDGSFFAIMTLPPDAIRGQVWRMASVDQDNDGDLDLAAANRDGPSVIFSNFAPLLSPERSLIESSGLSAAGSVAWGDVDGDGDHDLLFGAGPNAVGSKLFYNEGGQFLPENAVTYLPSGFGPHAVDMGDVTGNGQLDVVLALGSAAELQLYHPGNTSTPDWTSAPPHYANRSLAWGDADDDGDLDLLVGSDGPNRLYVNQGGGLAPEPGWVASALDDTRSVAWADFDGDRYLDFAVGNYGQANAIYHNERGLSFRRVWTSTLVSATTSVAWADYDGDGDPDLTVGNDGEANIIYENLGGSFSQVPIWRSSQKNKTTSLAWGDWNNDGDLDLAVGNWGQPDLVYANVNSKPGVPPQLYVLWASAEALQTTGLAWGDKDGDGDLDLAVSQSANALNGVYDNNYILPSHLTDAFAQTMPLPNNPPYVVVARPGTTASGYDRSSAELLSGPIQPTVTIRYKLFDPDGTRDDSRPSDEPGDPIRTTRFEFSLDGGATWRPATPMAASTPPTMTSRLGQDALFYWDALADQAISDDARFRVSVVHLNPLGPVQRASTSAISPPFRVRGTTCLWPARPAIWASNLNPAAGEPVRFEGSVAEGSGTMTFTWEFGDGGTDQGQVVYHAFDEGGPQGVTLTVHSEPCPLVKEVVATLSLAVGPTGPRVYLPFIARAFPQSEAPAPLSLPPDRSQGTAATRQGGRWGGEGIPAAAIYPDFFLRLQNAGPQGQASIHTTGLIKVTEHTQGVNNQPVVNSDGRRVAFWSTADLLGLGGNEDGNIEIFWADVDALGGVNRYQVTYSSGTILGGFNLAPTMNHAGTLIAFFSDRDLTGRETNKDANYEIFLARLGKRLTIQQLTFTEKGGNILPSLSGDGSHVAFASDRNLDPNRDNSDQNMEIFVLDLNSGVFTQVSDTPQGVINDEPDINADGTRIAYTSDGELVLAEVAPDGQITRYDIPNPTGGANRQPDISADGTRIAFLSGPDIPSEEIYLVEVSAGGTIDEPVAITDLPGEIKDEPAISADGTRIAFVSGRRLYFYDTEAQQLTDVPAASNVLHPSLSADGTRIAFVSDREIVIADTPRADLSIAKQASPARFVSGEPISYTLHVANAGPSPVFSATVSDTLPLEFLNPIWTCAASAGSSCGSGMTGTLLLTDSVLFSDSVDIAVGGALTYVVTGRLAPGAVGQIANTAEVQISEGGVDWKPDNNRATVVKTPYPQVDLLIAKWDAPDPVDVGAILTYTLVFTNRGPSDARSLIITDTLPGEVTFGHVVTQPLGWPTPTVKPPYVTWVTDTLLAHLGGTIVFTVTVNNDVAGGTVVSNSVTITSSTPERDPTNNDASVTTALQVRADLSIAKSGDPLTAVTAGTTLTYTLAYANEGPSLARSISITDTLPSGAEYGGVVSQPLGWSTTVQPPYVTWYSPTLVPKAAGEIVFTVTVDPGFTGMLTNSVVITSSADDPITGNNSADDGTEVTARAELSLAKSVAPEPAVSGGMLTYTLEFRNDGPSHAGQATISDTLPADVSFGGVLTATPQFPNFSQVGQVLQWVTPTLAVGTQGRLVFTATVADRVDEPLVNRATISSDADDSAPGDNSDEVTSTIGANLAITKTSSPNPAVPGASLTYLITVTNLGPSQVVNATVYDELPGDWRGNRITWACGASPGGQCTRPADDTFVLDDKDVVLPISGTVVYTATGTLAPDYEGTLHNTAVVTAPAWVTEPSTGDNRATDSNTAEPSADLQAAKSVDDARPVEGQTITYTIVVSNAGPSEASGVEISDTLPVSVTYLSHNQSEWDYDSDHTWTLKKPGRIAAGGAATLTIQVTVDMNTVGQTITNTATATATGTPDALPGNNTARVAATVMLNADLTITKRVTGPSGGPASSVRAEPGERITYTLEFQNNGPQEAVGVVLTDRVPVSVTNYNVSSSVVITDTGASPAYVWEVENLAPGGGGVITLTGLLKDPLATGTFTNTAEIDVTVSEDKSPDDNRSQAGVEVFHSADLVITKTVNSPTASPGERITYTLEFRNNGPQTALGVVLTDRVPVSVTAYSYVTSGAVVTERVGGPDYVWEVENLALGEGGVITVTGVLSDPLATGTFINTATITTTTEDPTPGNNSSQVSIEVIHRADLTITKTVNSPTALPGERITYTLEFRNDGPQTALGVVLTDRVPVSVTNYSYVTSGAVVAERVGGPDYVWDVQDLASGEGGVITVTGVLSDPLAAGTFINTATITTTTEDPTPGNNSGQASLTVQPFTVTLAGLATGQINVVQTYTATVGPSASLPLTYTWQASGQSEATHTSIYSRTDIMTYTWSTTGTQTIIVAVSNASGTVTATCETDTSAAGGWLWGPTDLWVWARPYLPLVRKG